MEIYNFQQVYEKLTSFWIKGVCRLPRCLVCRVLVFFIEASTLFIQSNPY